MNRQTSPINRLLVANRGEIAIRVFRAAAELGINTIAVYTHEDRYSLHRYKADEAYQIGSEEEPLKPYLDIEEILRIAKQNHVDAIHPGYGFLSENERFAGRCGEEGIVFIGPKPDVLRKLGDKVSAKEIVKNAGVPVIEDSQKTLVDADVARKEASRIGYPVILKAVAGGGGRGMRVAWDDEQLQSQFQEAKNEAKKAFGDDTVFLEKFIDGPKHIEVQILGDNFGNIVHLFERDCSIQRRFQKVIEIAPCPVLRAETKQKLYDYALSIVRRVEYNNAGTVEFLVDEDENIFFIEVNPRIQVEHTVTEEITGIDLVRAQILIAQDFPLDHPDLHIAGQADIKADGYAIQCRITTEDPENDFQPDYGTIIAYRSAGGFGIRLDAGSCYSGVVISPFFDSLLVKVSASGKTLKDASQRLIRALREFRIRGVKTNIGFLENVLLHPKFYSGAATVKFMEEHPEVFVIARKRDRGTKLLSYLAEVIVNGNPDVKYIDPNKAFKKPLIPPLPKETTYPEGSKDKLKTLGRERFIDWLKQEKQIQFTDTTFRDAHQSLLATRVRTIDMLHVAEGFAKNHPQVFSLEVWGGATFDVCMRFLHEDPWARLQLLRKAVPNILLQMLIRSSNAVGYTAYPDNLIEVFIEKSWENGIDIFRIFDSLNWVAAMEVSIKTVIERTDAIAEASICYTGDILDEEQSKYDLQYYLDLARQLEDQGAHILAIKDMAGLLKPYAAKVLITELKKVIAIPIHLHTHDTSSLQAATYLQAIEAGVDVVDVALSAMSGLTSQPNFNSIVAMLKHHDREQPYDLKSLNRYSNYWEDVREYYYPFESGLKSGTAEVYEHEIPGGQYSNLRPQARGLGLEDKFETIKENYSAANALFGNLIKVTPSSKVVGDMAMFMTANDLTVQDILQRGHSLSFPESVISLFRGDLGQAPGGLPQALSEIILKGEKPFTDKPNAHLEPVDFDTEFEAFQETFDEYCHFLDFLSYKLYPKVFKDFYDQQQRFGEVMRLPTPAFFFGLQQNEEFLVEIEKGKTLIIKMLYVSAPDEAGYRSVSFAMNGQTRRIRVKDQSLESTKKTHAKAEGKLQIGSPLPGKIAELRVAAGDAIEENDVLFVIEAMKMETSVAATFSGKIKKIHLNVGDLVEQDDLVVELDDLQGE